MTDTITVEAGKKIESFDGKIESAYGRELKANRFKDGFPVVSVLNYTATYEKLEKYDDIPEKEMPDKDDILAVVNNARKANARQKARGDALEVAGVIKPTMADDDELKIKSIMVGLLASKLYTEVTARAFARKALGLSEE
jgi:hypothetical protein